MNEQEQRVRDFYAAHTLSPERMEQLKAITRDNAEQLEQAHVQKPSLISRATAFGKSITGSLFASPLFRVAGVCAMVLIVSLWTYDSGIDNESTERTLREVAMNHSTRLQPEYHGETLAMLDDSMQQLPFTLVLPKEIKKKYHLLGSRYCSLGGILAAHIKFEDRDSGRPVSLFVVNNAAELKQINAQQAIVEGVDVEFWREGGLFFALAQRS